MEICFEVRIRVVEGLGCTRQDWIDQFKRDIGYEYPNSTVRVMEDKEKEM